MTTFAPPCIYNIQGLCADTIDISERPLAPSLKNEYNKLLDNRWLKRLNLEQNSILSGIEFCRILSTSLKNLEKIYIEEPQAKTDKRGIAISKGIELMMRFSNNPNTST